MRPITAAVLLLVLSAGRSQARPVHHSVLQTTVHSFDPLYSVETNSQMVITNSFDGLVQWTAKDGITPALATSWEFSPNKKDIIFTLRPGARFQDGSALSALDVVNHFKRIHDYHGYYSSHFANIRSVEAKPPGRVVFHLKEATSHFLKLLSGVAGRIVKRKDPVLVVGSGPYKPTAAPDGSKIILTRDLRYWGIAPTVDRIEFHVADESAALEMARRGELDDLAIFGLKQASYARLPPGKRLRQSLWATWAIAFDQRVKPLEQAALRRSLAERMRSIDWVQDLYPEQIPAYGLIPFGMPGHIGDPAHNAEKDSARLDCRSTRPCQVDIEIPDALETKEAISQWIQTKTDEIPGVTIKVRSSSFDSMMSRYASGVMGAYLVSFNAEYPDPAFLLRALQSKSKSNFLGIKDPEIDAWIEQLETTPDPSKQAEIFERFNSQLSQQAALIPLMHITHKTWVRDCVDGLELNPVGEGYFNFRGLINSCP